MTDRPEAIFFEIRQALDFFLYPVWQFLNSDFAATLLATLVAAFAGAFGAHVIIEKTKRKQEQQRELRITNAAIMVSADICSLFLNLKRQHVKDLKQKFQDDIENYAIVSGRSQKKGWPGQIFILQSNLTTLDPVRIPGEILVRQVFEDISPGQRAYTLTNTLIRSAHSLNRFINLRNEFGQKMKGLDNNDICNLYLGLPDEQGHVDRTYTDSVKHICNLTDDCIFFSKTLTNDLVEHGELLKTRLGKGAPRVNKPNFSNAEKEGLVPDLQRHKDWLGMFVKHDSLEPSRRSKLFSLFPW